jgi:Cys-tRNA(Pro) deacylase
LAKDKTPVTPAVRLLRRLGIEFTPCLYAYQDRGGTGRAARELGVDEHAVIKTLVMRDQDKKPLIVLMHGDREVSTKKLARALGLKSAAPCDPAEAQRHTGCQVGGISPFATRKALPVYVQETILELDEIYINAGKRGFLARMSPADLNRALQPVPVDAAQ